MPAGIDVEQRRRQVIEAAFRLVIADGMEAVSLRKVSDESGLNIGSVRHYFDGHHDLLTAAAEETATGWGAGSLATPTMDCAGCESSPHLRLRAPLQLYSHSRHGTHPSRKWGDTSPLSHSVSQAPLPQKCLSVPGLAVCLDGEPRSRRRPSPRVFALIFVYATLPRCEGPDKAPALREQLRTLRQLPISLGLLANCVLMAGSMMMLTYLSPNLASATTAGVEERALAFSLSGIAGDVAERGDCFVSPAGGSEVLDPAHRQWGHLLHLPLTPLPRPRHLLSDRFTVAASPRSGPISLRGVSTTQ